MSTSSLLIVLSACASVVYTSAVPEPVVTAFAVLPRQLDDDFIGYYSTYGEVTWDIARCAAFSSWTSSGSFGRCCSSSSSCEFATSCSGDYALVGGTSVSCPYTCNTDFLYASTGGVFSTKWVGCAITSTYFYESPPATAIVNTFAVPTDTTSGSARPTLTVSPVVPTYTPKPTPKKKKSMIWIVGVVIGVVALFAIAGIIAFILITRKKKKARAQALAAGQGNTYAGAPPANFQQPMQQQYTQGPPPTMGAMGQPQYGPPPPEGGYYTGDPKNTQLYPHPGPQSPPPPAWTPSQQQSPSQPPVSPQTRHTSLAPSDVLTVDQQRASSNMSPNGTVSEIGTGSVNNLGSNPNLPPQSPSGTHLTGISEMNTPPTYPAQATKPPMQGHNNQGPVPELQ